MLFAWIFQGRVRVGDVICGVDGRDVIGETVSVLRSLILGQEGSYVVLTFARAVEVTLCAMFSMHAKHHPSCW
jgi:C-terminal processing protease CtpA/Prc